MVEHSSAYTAMRFAKLLLVAWAAVSLAQMRTPSVEGLGPALVIAGLTWIVIRKEPPEDFRILRRPSAVIVMVAGWSEVGNHYLTARDAGLTPNQSFLASWLTVGGILVFIGLVGVLFLSPGKRNLANEPAQDGAIKPDGSP